MQSRNTPLPQSSPLATQECVVRPRKERWDLSSLFGALSWASLAFHARRTRAAFRSFRGHICILFATKAGVPVGHTFQLRAGCLVPNDRTYARAEGIKNLQATHPWVDNADLQIFLMGFDAGEAHCNVALASDQNIPVLHHDRNA